MAQIKEIAKDISNIAKSNIGGMLFPANGTDHPLLMAYYLKWGLQLTDNKSLDTTQEVIDYLLEKISDLNNRIANLEDQTEYTITVSSSSLATCNLSKIKKSGGTVTITPNSGYKITGVQSTNCSITHIDNSNKYNISNVTGNIILDVLTNEVDIQIEQLLNGNVLTINRPINKSDLIEIVSQTGGSINPTSILIGKTSSIIEPSALKLKYGNSEGSIALTFKGSDINAIPTITQVNKLEYSNLTASGVTLSTAGDDGTGALTITFNDVNGLYKKVFNVQVVIMNENSLVNVSSGWQYASNNENVAVINGLTITGKSAGTSRIAISYSGKWISLGDLTVGEESKKYYWYVGQEAVTADNYTTLAESSSTKYTTKNYTTEKYGKVYILVPNIVKSIKIKDVNLNTYVSEAKYKIDSTINIDGYNVYVTSAFGGKAPITIEYYY